MEKKINQLFKGDVIFEEGNYYLFLKGTHQKTARSKEVITLFLEDFITRKKFEKKFYHSETKFEVRTILQKKFNFLYLKGEAVSFLNIEEDSNFETEEIFLPQDSKLKNYS
jgi:translation elongation factor P/translation initiation factor 5A